MGGALQLNSSRRLKRKLSHVPTPKVTATECDYHVHQVPVHVFSAYYIGSGSFQLSTPDTLVGSCLSVGGVSKISLK